MSHSCLELVEMPKPCLWVVILWKEAYIRHHITCSHVSARKLEMEISGYHKCQMVYASIVWHSRRQGFIIRSDTPAITKGNTEVHDDVIKWKHFPRNWPFVWGIHRSRWIPHTKASDAELRCFSSIYVWINGWANNREAGDLRPHRGHYDVSAMMFVVFWDTFYKQISQLVVCGNLIDKTTQFCELYSDIILQWRHNGPDGVSSHQPHACLLNRLFRRRSKKTSKFIVTGLCAENSPVTSEFPAQMASYAENVSIWWRHHE